MTEIKSTDSPEQSISRLAADRKGSILVIALWSLCLLTTFSVYLGYGVRQKIALVKRLDEREKMYLISEAGVKKAIARLEGDSPKSYDALKDEWSMNTGIFKDIKVGDGIFNISYDYTNEQTGLSGTGYGLIDEERKININKSDLNTLKRLFRIILDSDDTQSQELAASIVDWRDADSRLSIPLGSAEDPYYRNLSYPYEAKDAEFEILEEILLVKGMDENLFERLKDYITIYGDGGININTASRAVLSALGLSESVIDKIMLFRYGEDGLPGTADDNVFDSPSGIAPKISQFYSLSVSELAQITAIAEQNLTVKSNNFMVKAAANLNNRKETTKITCVINRSGKILRWQGP